VKIETSIENLEINIFNQNGILLHVENEFNGGGLEYQFINGVYFLRISSALKTETFKLIKL
jgi:hypothetical protein